jgi:hypothetical protein
MRRERTGTESTPGATPAAEKAAPIPLSPVDLLAGIAPGLELTADDLPAGVAGATETVPATVTVEEVGKMLRCGEATVRRLIRTAVLRPVESDGQVRFLRRDVLSCRAGVLPPSPDKPGE